MCINCEDHCWGFLSSLLSDWPKFGNSITELKEYRDQGGFRLQFSFNVMPILQGHWCFGNVNSLLIPPGSNGKYYLYAHCWVLQVCQDSSNGLIKKSSAWYSFITRFRVRVPGAPLIAWSVCMALIRTNFERWWTTCFNVWNNTNGYQCCRRVHLGSGW